MAEDTKKNYVFENLANIQLPQIKAEVQKPKLNLLNNVSIGNKKTINLHLNVTIENLSISTEQTQINERITQELVDKTKRAFASAIQKNPELAESLSSMSPTELKNFLRGSVAGTAVVSAATGYNPNNGPLLLNNKDSKEVLEAGTYIQKEDSVENIQISNDKEGHLKINWEDEKF